MKTTRNTISKEYTTKKPAQSGLFGRCLLLFRAIIAYPLTTLQIYATHPSGRAISSVGSKFAGASEFHQSDSAAAQTTNSALAVLQIPYSPASQPVRLVNPLGSSGMVASKLANAVFVS